MSVPLGMSFEDRFKGGISDHFVMSKANKYEVCMLMRYVVVLITQKCAKQKIPKSGTTKYVLYLFKNRAQAIS